MRVYLTSPPRSPLARLATAIVGALLLVASFMIGMVAFVVLLGVGLVTGAWLWFRTRHLRRDLEAAVQRQAAPPGDAIEGEYRVVRPDNPEHREGEDRPSR